jgi:hypothetical protein
MEPVESQHQIEDKTMKYIYILLIAITFSGCSTKSRTNEELEIVLGMKMEDPQLIFKNDIMGGFNEGYTLEVIKLSDKDIQNFHIILRSQDYPLEDQNWQVIKWKESPIEDSLVGVEELILNYHIKDNTTRAFQDEIRKLLGGQNEVYYSAYYKEVADNVVSVKFYLIDLRSKKIFMIKSNS